MKRSVIALAAVAALAVPTTASAASHTFRVAPYGTMAWTSPQKFGQKTPAAIHVYVNGRESLLAEQTGCHWRLYGHGVAVAGSQGCSPHKTAFKLRVASTRDTTTRVRFSYSVGR